MATLSISHYFFEETVKGKSLTEGCAYSAIIDLWTGEVFLKASVTARTVVAKAQDQFLVCDCLLLWLTHSRKVVNLKHS